MTSRSRLRPPSHEPLQWFPQLSFTPFISAIFQSSKEAVPFLLHDFSLHLQFIPSQLVGNFSWAHILPYSEEPSFYLGSCFPSPTNERTFSLDCFLIMKSLPPLSTTPPTMLHFPNVVEQFSSMSLPILEMFSSALMFTTSSLTPLPGFWTSSYNSSNPS